MSKEQVKEPRASCAVTVEKDAGLELMPAFEERLRQAEEYVASGGCLLSMEELTGQLEDASDV